MAKKTIYCDWFCSCPACTVLPTEDAMSPLPPRVPEPKRERRGYKARRSDFEDYWRPDPAEHPSYADMLSLAFYGETLPEPRPPEGWKDWPRDPVEAARRLAPEWYGIDPQNVMEDPADGAIIVTGLAR